MMVDLADLDLEVKIHLRRWGEVAEALRQRTSPLPPKLHAALANKIDPEVKDKKGRRAAPWENANRDRGLCYALGIYRALIGRPGGPINENDARDRTCRDMGASDGTLRQALQNFPALAKQVSEEARKALEE